MIQISCSRSYCHKNELVSFFFSLRIQTLFQQTTGYFYLLLPLENYPEHLEIASNSSRARNFFLQTFIGLWFYPHGQQQ